MYYTDGFRDAEAEDFIREVFDLLNGVVNPDTLVRGICFKESVKLPLGCVIFEEVDGVIHPGNIEVGSKNIRDFIASHGRLQAYTLFIDFVVHELYHTTQNIDLPRYVSDDEYNDMIETDCEYHTALFMTNYFDWLESHLSKPFDKKIQLSDKFFNYRNELQREQTISMMNDPWIIKA